MHLLNNAHPGSSPRVGRSSGGRSAILTLMYFSRAPSEALVREIELKAHAVVISGAIANAVERGVPLVQAEAQRHFPDRAKIFPNVLHGGTKLYLDRDSAAAFATLHASAALAAELTIRHITMVSVGNCYRLALSGAADAWRTTATQAVEAIKQAALLLSNTGAAYRLADPDGLIRQLSSVAAGSTIGVGPDGRVTAPAIREERRHTRYLKSIPATIVGDTFEAPVMVRDISRGGCGFDTTRRFPISTVVTIIMQDRSRFTGHIVWTIGMSAGLQFDELIDEQEAMFAGERRGGR